LIRYIVDGEPIHQAVVHAAMMAGAEAQGGAKDIGYVLCCKDCREPIDDHYLPGGYERCQKTKSRRILS
jgi:hypothetical protein